MALFGNSKVAVIESKIQGYEKYFEKLDESIEKLSEVSVGIKEMLIRHEGKLDERVLSEENINLKLEEIKKESHSEHVALEKKIISLETKIEDIFKWKWTAAGAILILGLFIGQIFPNGAVISPGEPLVEFGND
jgi:hypothetical protein